MFSSGQRIYHDLQTSVLYGREPGSATVAQEIALHPVTPVGRNWLNRSVVLANGNSNTTSQLLL